MTTLRSPRRSNGPEATTLAHVLRRWGALLKRGSVDAPFTATLAASLPVWRKQGAVDPRFASTLARMAPSIREWCRAAAVEVPDWLSDSAASGTC